MGSKFFYLGGTGKKEKKPTWISLQLLLSLFSPLSNLTTQHALLVKSKSLNQVSLSQPDAEIDLALKLNNHFTFLI